MTHITVEEAAARAGVSPYTIQRWCKRGHVQSVKVGRSIGVCVESLEAVLENYKPGKSPGKFVNGGGGNSPKPITINHRRYPRKSPKPPLTPEQHTERLLEMSRLAREGKLKPIVVPQGVDVLP